MLKLPEILIPKKNRTHVTAYYLQLLLYKKCWELRRASRIVEKSSERVEVYFKQEIIEAELITSNLLLMMRGSPKLEQCGDCNIDLAH